MKEPSFNNSKSLKSSQQEKQESLWIENVVHVHSLIQVLFLSPTESVVSRPDNAFFCPIGKIQQAIKTFSIW